MVGYLYLEGIFNLNYTVTATHQRSCDGVTAMKECTITCRYFANNFWDLKSAVNKT